MKKDKAYALFEEMIRLAEQELRDFTLHNGITSEKKADKSLVTACDIHIDQILSKLASEQGLQLVSEEGVHTLEIVKSGNYITIDPIDGTLGYIDYVNHAVEQKSLSSFLEADLGPTSDFCLLLGIVENGIPQFGAVYNYITKETILIDGNDRNNLIRTNNKRNHTQENAVYLDQRFIDDPITKELLSLPDVTAIRQATFGLKSIYTILNPHKSAVMVHRVQSAGLWDVLPAAVAARAFGGSIYDDTGEPLKFTEYIMLPGKGGTVIKGDKFASVVDQLAP